MNRSIVRNPSYNTDTVWDVGFRYTYLPEGFIEERNAVYSENGLVILPLNPTYVLTTLRSFIFTSHIKGK